jgi:glycosyltransferase involved in cell wall biosynthesis
MSWAREFHDAGHEVTVLKGDGQETASCAYFTESLDRDIKVIVAHNPMLQPAGEAKHDAPRLGAMLEGIKGLIKRNLPILDSYGLWARDALSSLAAVIENDGSFDIIVSTSFPLSAHRVAYDIKRRYGGIWSADFRDFYGQFDSNAINYSSVRGKYLSAFFRSLGKAADLVTMASEPLKELIAFHVRPRSTLTLFNGYFAEHLPSLGQRTIQNRILYTGSYNAHEFSVAPLVEALAALKAEGLALPEPVFTGPVVPQIEEAFSAIGLTARFIGSASNKEVLRLQAESAFLLLCDAMSGKGTLLTKSFEYMAALRPIIVLTKESSDLTKKVFTAPQNGYCVTLDPKAIADFIKAWPLEREALAEDFFPSDFIAEYSRERQARLLREALETMVKRNA